MAKLKEVQDKRSKAIADARAIEDKVVAEKRDMTTEERVAVDKLLEESLKFKTEAEAITKQIADDEARTARLAAEEADLNSSAGRRTHPGRPGGDDPARGGGGGGGRGDDDDGSGIISGRRRGGDRELRWRNRYGQVRCIQFAEGTATAADEYRDNFGQYLKTGRRDGLTEARAMQADSDVDGGYLVMPMQMAAGLIKFLDDAVHIRALATQVPVTSAQSLGAVSLDTDFGDAEWSGEITDAPEDTTGLKFGGRELNPTPLSKEAKLSRKLLRIAMMNIEALVNQRLGYKFAVTEEKAFLTGDGANKPLGVFTASTSGITTARDVSTGNSTTEIKADGLVNAMMSLKLGYRNSSTLRWIFHRDAVKQIMLLKDGQGRYLWREGLAGVAPDLILNKQYLESEFAPNTFTTGQYVGILGDFSFYWIADSMAMSIQRLDELYAKSNRIGFIGRKETDAMPVLAEAFARVKLA